MTHEKLEHVINTQESGCDCEFCLDFYDMFDDLLVKFDIEEKNN